MISLELIKPGIWLNHYQDNRMNSSVSIFLFNLIDSFYEANQSLNLFDSEYNEEIDLDYFDLARKYRTEIQSELIDKIGNENYFNNYEENSFKIEIAVQRRLRKDGIFPRLLKDKNIFIFANSFLYSLDNFQKTFKALLDKKDTTFLPIELGSIYRDFCKYFKDLVKIRDSAHHMEERIQGLQYGKPINPKPIDNGAIKISGSMVLNQLSNRKYGNTLRNGDFGEIEVTEESLRKVQSSLQNIIDVFEWTGSKEYLPK